MRNLLMLAALAGVLASGPIAAAPIDYCEDYAGETVAVLTAAGLARETPDKLRDRAFFECLNMDDEPPMPSDLAGSAKPAPGEIEQGSTDADLPALEASGPAEASPGRSRLPAGTDKWRAWCRKHFPKSFDEATGTIVPSETGRREAC